MRRCCVPATFRPPRGPSASWLGCCPCYAAHIRARISWCASTAASRHPPCSISWTLNRSWRWPRTPSWRGTPNRPWTMRAPRAPGPDGLHTSTPKLAMPPPPGATPGVSSSRPKSSASTTVSRATTRASSSPIFATRPATSTSGSTAPAATSRTASRNCSTVCAARPHQLLPLLANQLRVLMTAATYVLMQELRLRDAAPRAPAPR